jgi:hypothetical protein
MCTDTRKLINYDIYLEMEEILFFFKNLTQPAHRAGLNLVYSLYFY